MALQTTNIVISPGRFYIAPVGTAIPDENQNTLTWASPWDEVGYTDGGIELVYGKEIFEAFVDQEKGASSESGILMEKSR